MKGKNEIIEKINSKLSNFSEDKLKKIENYFENMPTDSSSNEHSPKNKSIDLKEKVNTTLVKEYFHPLDDFHNSQINFDIQDQNFEKIKSILNLSSDNEINLLREISTFLLEKDNRVEYDINQDMVTSVLGDVVHKLELLGENTTDIVESNNLT